MALVSNPRVKCNPTVFSVVCSHEGKPDIVYIKFYIVNSRNNFVVFILRFYLFVADNFQLVV